MNADKSLDRLVVRDNSNAKSGRPGCVLLHSSAFRASEHDGAWNPGCVRLKVDEIRNLNEYVAHFSAHGWLVEAAALNLIMHKIAGDMRVCRINCSL